MATRSTIKIKGIKYAKVYKHWDGYPKAMLDWLNKFNQDFTKNRGDDPEYKFAQLLRSSVKLTEEFDLSNDDYTGWGILKYDDNAREEYEYTLHANGEVTYKQI